MNLTRDQNNFRCPTCDKKMSGINESHIWNLIKKAMIRYQSATKQFEDQQAVYSIVENLIDLFYDVVVKFRNSTYSLRFIEGLLPNTARNLNQVEDVLA